MPFRDDSIRRFGEHLRWDQLPRESKTGIQILLNAHDHIWKDRTLSLVTRVASCRILADLVTELMTHA